MLPNPSDTKEQVDSGATDLAELKGRQDLSQNEMAGRLISFVSFPFRPLFLRRIGGPAPSLGLAAASAVLLP